MNKLCHRYRYDFVESSEANGDTIGGCFIYRRDRLEPIGPTGRIFQKGTVYRERYKTHAFRDLSTHDCFVVSLNHLRSKRGPAHISDSIRLSGVKAIVDLLNQVPEVYRDTDILILGDFNCYTHERPIQYLIRQGYADQVMRFDSTGYSYVYRSEAGFLDRVFASPSMADKIIGVKALHLNADCFYSLGYRSRYAKRNRFRYSDHDPVLIYLHLQQNAAAR